MRSGLGCWERSFVGCPVGCFRDVQGGVEGSEAEGAWGTWSSGSDFFCCLYDSCCFCEAVANPAASAAVLSPSHPWCSDEPCGSRSGFPFTKTILSPYTNLGCDPVRMLLPLHARTAQHQHNSSSSNRVPVCPVSRRRSPRKRAKRSHCFYFKKKPLKISDRYSLSCTCDRRPLSPRLSITPLSPRLLPGASLTFSQWSVRFDAAQLSDSKARRTQRPCAISRSKH